jgi:hypothetical protein
MTPRACRPELDGTKARTAAYATRNSLEPAIDKVKDYLDIKPKRIRRIRI